MKKVIDGKVYNTETAEEICTHSNGYNCTDFNHVYEVLYRTKKGAYFLYGEGGPRSKYAVSYGNCTGGGSGITVLTTEEAFEWCQEHDEIEAIEEYFSDMVVEA